MLIDIKTYVHFGTESKFVNKKEFTKIGKKWNIQNKHNKWMTKKCTFLYNQIFDAESGEMQEPIMFFGDLDADAMGSTAEFDNWYGGNYNFEIYKINNSSSVMDEGTYTIITPVPENIKLGNPMDLHGTFECPTYVFKDWELETIFNMKGVAVCYYTDGSKLLLLGSYIADDDGNIVTDWESNDFNVPPQDLYVTEAETAERFTQWNTVLGNLLLPPPPIEKETDEEKEHYSQL